LRRALLWLGLAAFAAACAGPADQEPAPTPRVDVADVVSTGTVKPVGGITAAGQPDAAAFKVFADAGYVAVIDMRGPEENRGMADEPGLVESLGLTYVAFPLASREDISFANARELDRLLAEFDGPVLLHCASGNRIGAILALRESLNGASDKDAIAYGRNAGLTRLEPLVKERLQED
jgi:uncharacterized protein (TIGR01244 family)